MSDQPEAPQPTVKERLTAHMVGYPFSLIPWPHRVLHDAVAEIESLKAERDALKAEVERLNGVCYDLIGQLMVLNATKQMQATIDAARSKA